MNINLKNTIVFWSQNSPNDLRLSKTRNPMEELNIGGLLKNPDTDLLVTKSVYLNKSDAENWKKWMNNMA